MPPVYAKINVIKTYDGESDLDLRDQGINLIYFPNYIEPGLSDTIFKRLSGQDTPLKQHTYLGNFGRTMTPKRLTYASVPDRARYRYKGKDLIREKSETYNKIFSDLCDQLPDDIIRPDASISNAYRYNGVDYIATHIDDEKFLETDNYSLWSDSTVCTYTFLDDIDKPMTYNCGDPKTSIGVSIKPRHGSLIIQGSVLHEILPIYSKQGDIGRVSVTLRKLQGSCKCTKISCPTNNGPSNYLYYSNHGNGHGI